MNIKNFHPKGASYLKFKKKDITTLMSKGALRILLYQTDLYFVMQYRYLQKKTLMSKLFSYII